MSTTKLRISDDLSLPIDAATQTFAFIARKGAGKTYAAGKLTELLLDAGVQVVVLDTVGNWYGLRLAADGKSTGFDVPVLGGLRGDIPLEAAGGALIADIVVDTGRSMVIDVSQFSLADRKRFATSFGERLWLRKKGETHPAPLHLVIEESQLIVPQFTGAGGDQARMLGIYEEIIRLGRNYGIGVSMITQRPQSVNKEVLNQTECLLVGQVNGSQERDALKKWITHQGMDVHLVDELPGLKIGTFYIWSPQWLELLQKIQIGTKKTFDASATPKVGDRQVRRELKPLDLADLQQKLKETIERQKADDPRELKKTISDLRKQLAAQPAAPPKIVEKPVVTDAQIKSVESIVSRLEKEGQRRTEAAASLRESGEQLASTAREFAAALRSASSAPQQPARVPPSQRPAPVRSPVSPRPRPASGGAVATGTLPIGERKILTACIQYPDGVTREQLTVLTGYKRSSRDTYLQRLRERGFADAAGDKIVATDAGVAELGSDVEPLPTGEALRDYWRGRLPQGELAIFDVLVGAYPDAVTRDSLSESTGYQRSSRDTYLQRMNAKRLIQTVGRGEVRASDELF